MKEELGDLWKVPADAKVIPTNGTVRRDGACVMGRGLAEQAKRVFPGVEYVLGGLIRQNGNHVHVVHRPVVENGRGGAPAKTLVFFPVKHAWPEDADLALIHRSATELVTVTDCEGWKRVCLPRVGCGNGRLLWTEVRSTLQDVLKDDRFVVILGG